MEDFEVVIHIPGIKEIQKNVIEYNRALEDLATSLQSEYGTTNMATAMSIAAASSFFEIGLNVASFGFGFAGLFGSEGGYGAWSEPFEQSTQSGFFDISKHELAESDFKRFFDHIPQHDDSGDSGLEIGVIGQADTQSILNRWRLREAGEAAMREAGLWKDKDLGGN